MIALGTENFLCTNENSLLVGELSKIKLQTLMFSDKCTCTSRVDFTQFTIK